MREIKFKAGYNTGTEIYEEGKSYPLTEDMIRFVHMNLAEVVGTDDTPELQTAAPKAE